jgi:hypothetical protein
MATNKNQHFVPRCYLKPFTINEGDTAINLFNLDRQRFIENAPVKNQCSGNYFYGKDIQLEKVIQSIEGKYADLLKRIVKSEYVLNDDDKTILRIFWLFQHQRTEAAALKMVSLNHDMAEEIGFQNPSFKIEIKEAVMMAMRTFSTTMHVIDDLKICLIKNKSKIPFITSDDPAVLTNRWWLSDSRTKGDSFGMISAGSITLLPITPSILCCGYDGDVYSLSHNHGIVDVRNEKDISLFNLHQLLNCRANLFTGNKTNTERIKKLCVDYLSLRPKHKHILTYAVFDGIENNHKKYRVVDSKDIELHTEAVIHSKFIHPIPPAWPRQLSFRHKGSIFTNGTAMGYLRRAIGLEITKPPFRKERA